MEESSDVKESGVDSVGVKGKKRIKKVSSDLMLKRANIYKMLYKLRTERSVSQFERMMDGFLNILEKEQPAFSEYFKKYYASSERVKMWALCHRESGIITTTSHIENFHKILKWVFFRGKRNREVHLLVDMLMGKVESHYYKMYTVQGEFCDGQNAKTKKYSRRIALAREIAENMVGDGVTIREGITSILIGEYQLLRNSSFVTVGCGLKANGYI